MSDNETAVANPDVQVPEGNFKAGKTLFEDLCKSCHKMRVPIGLGREMEVGSRPPHWAG